MNFIRRPKVTSPLAASFNDVAIDITTMDKYSYSVRWTDAGSLDGTLKLQGSNDAYEIDPPRNSSGVAAENSDAIWDDIPGSEVTIGTDDTQLWNVTDVAYTAVRLVYTWSAGDGTLEIVFRAKGPLK